MAQRPERLMATKVYAKESVRARNVPSSALTPVTNFKNIQNGIHAHDKGIFNGKIQESLSKEAAQRKTHSDDRQQKGKPPIGFVTREEMVNRVNSRRSKKTDIKTRKVANTVVEEKRNRVPVGFVTREEMEVRVFIRKLKASNEKQSSLDVYPSIAGNNTTVASKPKSIPRSIKPKQMLGKYAKTVVKEEIELKLNTNAAQDKTQIQTPPLSNGVKASGSKLQTKNELDTIFPLSDEGHKPFIANGRKRTNDIGRIDSCSTLESGIIVTERSTSTAITRQSKQQPNSSEMSSSSVKVLVMNVNGNNDKRGSVPERRRQAIQNIVSKHKPDVVLFQEFSWSGITGKTWSKHPIPEQFVYTGHFDASIMYNSETFTNVQNLPASDLDTIVRRLQSSSNNLLERPFPLDFNPISRMCAKIITTSTQPSLEFLCISWHGCSNKKGGGSLKELIKIEYFEYWMEFLRNIREKFKLPILAAGDYNVKMFSIEKFVQSPFKLCKYEGSKRRTKKGIIDFCIVTDDLELSNTTWVDLERNTSVEHPNSILDHDPLIATLDASTFGVTGAAMGFGKKTSWPSPIVKMR